jgi:hypothetical protein
MFSFGCYKLCLWLMETIVILLQVMTMCRLLFSLIYILVIVGIWICELLSYSYAYSHLFFTWYLWSWNMELHCGGELFLDALNLDYVKVVVVYYSLYCFMFNHVSFLAYLCDSEVCLGFEIFHSLVHLWSILNRYYGLLSLLHFIYHGVFPSLCFITPSYRN